MRIPPDQIPRKLSHGTMMADAVDLARVGGPERLEQNPVEHLARIGKILLQEQQPTAGSTAIQRTRNWNRLRHISYDVAATSSFME
jgi:hypothetical protein